MFWWLYYKNFKLLPEKEFQLFQTLNHNDFIYIVIELENEDLLSCSKDKSKIEEYIAGYNLIEKKIYNFIFSLFIMKNLFYILEKYI